LDDRRGEVGVAFGDLDARVAEEVADFFEAPGAAPPAGDER
jgi:hypothetical protein